jgi:hypothetical protein
MDRFAEATAIGLLLAAIALAGCNGGASGLLTGATAADAPGKLSNEDPLARPIAVAWTSARAHRCGFYFDPAKLKASYLAFEAKQSGGDQVAKAEKTYDTTFRTIRQRVASDPDYCSDRKSAEIKADLQRHLAGDFTPKLPQPKKEESCGFFGCVDASDQKWTPEKFWEEQAKKDNMAR